MPSPSQPASSEHQALELDARDSIAKALWLFENGEKAAAQHMFERLAQRVRQAGPVAMLVSGSDSIEEREDLQGLISAISDVAALRPEDDEQDDESAA